MILMAIIDFFFDVLQAIMSVLPTIPSVPTAISDGGTWVVTTIEDVIAILRLFYGSTLLNAIVVVCVAILTFEWIYHGIMWIVRKIPMINMK